MPTIQIRSLNKTFGSYQAVRDLNLDVEEGEVVGLLGPSGCGKTTTLRCLAGLEDPTTGSIKLHGQEVWSTTARVPPERRNIGMVFQSYALWPHMTVEDNVAFALSHGSKRRRDNQAVSWALDTVGLLGLEKRYPAELSGGQQQRVALARAIVSRPSLLLFDEPLSNLDAKLRNAVRIELKTLLRELGATAVYVTHDQKEAMALCDRIAVMFGGEICQIGPPESVYSVPESLRVGAFVGDTNILPYTLSEPTGLVLDGLQVDQPSQVCPPDAPDAGFVLFRPDHLELDNGAAATPGQWLGTVEDVLFSGSVTEVVVQIEESGRSVTAYTEEFAHFTEGQSVVVTPKWSKATWLPHDLGTEEAFKMALSRDARPRAERGV